MDFIYQNRLKYQPIIHTLEHEMYDQLVVSGQSISLYAPDSQLWMISLHPGDDHELVWPKAEVELALLIGDTGLDDMTKRYGLSHIQTCVQFVHLAGPVAVPASDLAIQLLSMSDLDYVAHHYKMVDRADLERKIARGTMYGGYKESQLIGFIGTHDEGSMGLLYINPDHRRQGYGEVLEAWLTNQQLAKGVLPFGHVEVDNERSLNLQRKFGASQAPELVYWMW